jgi:hypothetical protein
MTTDQLSEVRTLLQRAQTAPTTEAALDLAVGAYKQAAGYITLAARASGRCKGADRGDFHARPGKRTR